ncbi:ATP-binding protein [Geodermatophilus sp. SYSU D00814]
MAREPGTAAELTGLRRRLRAALAGGGLPAGTDDGERLLLVVEELASNGLRHGRPPVQITVTAAGPGWLVEVRDTATARLPTPAIGRDAALGGMGLHLVARLSHAHGWAVDGDRKTVWAYIAHRPPSPAPPPQRIRAATERARDLSTYLAATEVRIAATLQRTATDAAVEGRHERADVFRVVAECAHRDAEQARRTSLPRSRPPPGETAGPVLGPVDRTGSGRPSVGGPAGADRVVRSGRGAVSRSRAAARFRVACRRRRRSRWRVLPLRARNGG